MRNNHYEVLFKQRKHKTFNYQPRFSKEPSLETKSNEGAEAKDFKSRWRRSHDSKVKVRGAMSIKVLVIILVLLLIGMYVLEKKYL
ncbi:hypothetical protein KFZ70_08900 [Tamlana fucoidanivorans]|uniref:Uncharacterized protein n=1 Tax=Allotamlana fucoidanivorans TaxID=2583814 RepID=A0A5C4SPQ9_9FLAO|nr:hypothetical protein [Tamlana fucoidanivorans]TNJ46120.1 hypothetical protein FGF67_03780 [Tamlana fucoidanivorans]